MVEASCADKDSLLSEVDAREPDVVVTDVRMPPTSTDEGIEVAARLRETHPRIGVVILSQYSDPSYALRLFDSGSDGRAYLLKDRVHNRAELLDAIEATAAGRSVVDPKVVEILVHAQTRTDRSSISELTPRELEVLAAIAEGKSNTAIAEGLVLTKRAVEKHINAIFLKVGLTHAADSGGSQQAGEGRAAVPGGDPGPRSGLTGPGLETDTPGGCVPTPLPLVAGAMDPSRR